MRVTLGRLFGVAGRRLVALPLTLLGVLVLTFLVMRALPQDQASLRLGAAATPEAVASLRSDLGLDRPIYSQFTSYLTGALHGDLGVSFRTSNPVTEDLLQRFPATLELILLAMILALSVSLPMAVLVAMRPRGILDRVSRVYGLVAGGIPDFWMALILIYLLYFQLGIAAAPVGRLPFDVLAPPRVTGFMTVDSLIAARPDTFIAALGQLALPVLTLAFVSGGAFFKMFSASMRRTLAEPYVEHAHALGVRRRHILRGAVRAALPSTLTLIGVQTTFLLGGAVLVESLFGWDGLGRYAVDAILNADFNAVQGFVLVAGTFTALVYLVTDLLQAAVDPRVEAS